MRCGGWDLHDDCAVFDALGKLASNVKFLFRSHGGAGGLFAVAEGGVEDADIRGVRDVVGDVRRTKRGRGSWG
ncbi:hypothetical protein TSUD_00490 [Trifolium subterraneum]|nr:hypothetical protein TSUD_00490 [Trifolium subterraneum]